MTDQAFRKSNTKKGSRVAEMAEKTVIDAKEMCSVEAQTNLSNLLYRWLYGWQLGIF